VLSLNWERFQSPSSCLKTRIPTPSFRQNHDSGYETAQPMKTISLIGVLATVGLVFTSMLGQNAGRVQTSLDYRVALFQLKDVGFVDAVAELSLQPVGDLHLGMEEVLREGVTDPQPQNPRFSPVLRNSTVREILNVLCGYDNRYTWAQDGETINIYPKATADDGSYLLNRRLEHIAVSGILSPEGGLTFLDKQLPPPREQLAYAGAGGDSSFSLAWNQVFEGLTVRQFINRLSEHMGPHTSWVFYGSRQERLFTFRKGGFH
jgi:hypothetical protein